MNKILFVDSVAGIAGDMFVASFIDAGLVAADELVELPSKIGYTGVRIEVGSVIRATMRATTLQVVCEPGAAEEHLSHSHSDPVKLEQPHIHYHHANFGSETHPTAHVHTHYLDIDRRIGDSELPGAAKDFARKVFRLIAEAEADSHGMAIDQVIFHEVGTIDSIIDVVMAGYCVAKVNADAVIATPVKPGRGLVRIAHGTHPIPPPATARLLKGMAIASVPDSIQRSNVELSTPTGVAILKALNPSFGTDLPAGRLVAVGMGAGSMDLGSYPNVTRILLVEPDVAASQGLPYERDCVMEICWNCDDETSERTAWVMEKLFSLNILDAWQTPIVGKKGRLATCCSVLVQHSDWQTVSDWILRHASTFGLRYRSWDRLKLQKHFESGPGDGANTRIKVGSTVHGERLKSKPEFEDQRRKWDDMGKPS